MSSVLRLFHNYSRPPPVYREKGHTIKSTRSILDLFPGQAGLSTGVREKPVLDNDEAFRPFGGEPTVLLQQVSLRNHAHIHTSVADK